LEPEWLAPFLLRYTSSKVKKFIIPLLVLLVGTLVFGEETSFSRVTAPDSKGKLTKAILTLSDEHKAVEVHLTKGSVVSIPYSEIDKFSYEYTKKRRINEESILTAPVGGAIAMLTKSKSHWLEIHYHEGNLPKSYVLRMDKHGYIRILDAVKAHTGKDAEVLGNADKR
jgi:poly-beta-hydroxyalkanoate depolymerase